MGFAHAHLLRRNDSIPHIPKATFFKPAQLDIHRVGGIGDNSEQKAFVFQGCQRLGHALEKLHIIVFFIQNVFAAVDLVCLGNPVKAQRGLPVLVLGDFALISLVGEDDFLGICFIAVA